MALTSGPLPLAQLDAILNGAPVRIYKRADGTCYATLHDFDRFGLKPLSTVRVRLTSTSTEESVLNAPVVLAALAKLEADR